MTSMRVIKNRIRSVKSTEQITNAMNLVAASKLQKIKSKLLASRPFYHETEVVIGNILNNSKNIKHPCLQERSSDKILIILITGDRGLCGGYNSNVSKEARKLIRGTQQGALIIVGTKGKDFFVRRGKNVLKTITNISENPFYTDAAEIGTSALDLYNKGEYDKVYLVYTEFLSTISYVPKTLQLLPIDTSKFNHNNDIKTSKTIMNYEPNEYEILDYVIPKYINTTIFGALMESSTCQQAARMTSMDAATENANKMISKLALQYNRARQSAITQELTEIVSGANAL